MVQQTIFNKTKRIEGYDRFSIKIPMTCTRGENFVIKRNYASFCMKLKRNHE